MPGSVTIEPVARSIDEPSTNHADCCAAASSQGGRRRIPMLNSHVFSAPIPRCAGVLVLLGGLLNGCAAAANGNPPKAPAQSGPVPGVYENKDEATDPPSVG